MNRFFIIIVLLSLSCDPKKKEPQQKTGFSTVKLHIKSDIELEPGQQSKDLEIIKKRLLGTKVFKSLKLNTKKSIFFTFEVSNYGKNRRFLNRFKHLLQQRGFFELRPIFEYPPELLNSKRSKSIHKISTFGISIFRSASKRSLRNFINTKKFKNREWFTYRIPKGVRDFPKSNWAAYLTGKPIPFEFKNSRNMFFSRESNPQEKGLAVILDSAVLQLVEIGVKKKISISDTQSRFSHKQIELIIKYGVLSGSWRISRIEASQEM